MVAQLVPGTTRQSVLLHAMHLDAAQGVALYPSGVQIVRVAAAVIHGCPPLLPKARAASKAMLHIAFVPPKSVDRTCFYETFIISTSKGLVNLAAAEPP